MHISDPHEVEEVLSFFRNAQLLEFKCVEFVEELMYGHLRKKTGDDKLFAAARMRWP